MLRRAASGEHRFAKRHAVDIGRIEGDQHGIEFEFLHRGQQNRGIVVAGNAQVTHAALGPGLQEGFHGPALAEDPGKIILAAKVVQLPEIQVIGVQPPQAVVEKPERPIVGAIVGLGGQEDRGAMFAQGQAVIVHTAGVGGGSFEVIHALLQGTLDHGDGLGFPAMRSQDALAAEAENRDGLTGTTQRAAWDRRGC